MYENIFSDDVDYVCISHLQKIPCEGGENHLISNWPSDVAKVLDSMQDAGYYINSYYS